MPQADTGAHGSAPAPPAGRPQCWCVRRTPPAQIWPRRRGLRRWARRAARPVKLDVAELVDNGNVVPITVTVESPMTAADHVKRSPSSTKRIPQRDVARFTLGPRAGKAECRRASGWPPASSWWPGAHERRQLLVDTVDVIVTCWPPASKGTTDGPHPDPRCRPAPARRGDRDPRHHRATRWKPVTARADGKIVPRDIIRRFSCRYNGELVFSAELFSGRRGQSLYRLPHRGHRERHAGIRMARRQRLRADERIACCEVREARLPRIAAPCSWAAPAPPAAADTRRSGFEDMGASTQAMQRDDALNPAMLWVKDGEQLWKQPPPAPAARPAQAAMAAAPAACAAWRRATRRGT
jgi:hypothetical protein